LDLLNDVEADPTDKMRRYSNNVIGASSILMMRRKKFEFLDFTIFNF